MCHPVQVSLCLCVTMSVCRSDPVLFPCVCVPMTMCPHPSGSPHIVHLLQSKTSSISRNGIKIKSLFAYTFFSFFFFYWLTWEMQLYVLINISLAFQLVMRNLNVANISEPNWLKSLKFGMMVMPQEIFVVTLNFLSTQQHSIDFWTQNLNIAFYKQERELQWKCVVWMKIQLYKNTNISAPNWPKSFKFGMMVICYKTFSLILNFLIIQ